MSNEARIASVLNDLRIVQVEIDQHQISRRNHISGVVNASTGILSNQFRHPSIFAVTNLDALRGTRKHEVIQVKLYLMTFLNLKPMSWIFGDMNGKMM
jgi:hypothetical protein